MKKIFAMLLVLGMVASMFVACDSKKDEDATDAATGDTAAATEAATEAGTAADAETAA